jgi:hypothetical protein
MSGEEVHMIRAKRYFLNRDSSNWSSQLPIKGNLVSQQPFVEKPSSMLVVLLFP